MQVKREHWFDHEKLEVYQEGLAFAAWLSCLLEERRRLGEMKDQLDRACSSIVLNIAEGNGKYTHKDRCRFLDTANASALECAAGLDILVARRKLTPQDIRSGKESLQRIVRMRIGLLRTSTVRSYPKRPAAAQA